jgi:hypothetical protein
MYPASDNNTIGDNLPVNDGQHTGFICVIQCTAGTS